MLFLPNKNILIIILALLLSSCNPFISKELRHKKRCNRKLERVIKKCPELLQVDTIRDTVEIIIPPIDIDSSIQLPFDTLKLDSILQLIKDTTTQRVIRKYIINNIYPKDTIKHVIDGFTFSFWFTGSKMYYSVDKPLETLKKEVVIPVQKITPIQLTIWDQIMLGLGKFWWWLVIAAILFVAYRLLLKK